MNVYFKKIGIMLPKILLPNKKVDLKKWSVVACDQYTSEPAYWQKVSKIVGRNPSTLGITYPEIYLESKNKPRIIERIKSNMKKFLKETLEPINCFIYVDRRTLHAKSRKGLIAALDLENYDYNKGSRTLIRATEGTVLKRLPPRIEIRKDALLELPHIMVLIDDPQRTVIEPIVRQVKKLKKLYDFELMMKGGHIKGYEVQDPKIISKIVKALENLAEPKNFNKKYNLKNKKVLLFAVGDGNHSLATAKAVWEMTKKHLSPKERKNNSARFALVELVNVHDPGIKFEPIHRVVFNVKLEEMFQEMKDYFENQKSNLSYRLFSRKSLWKKEFHKSQKGGQHSISFSVANKLGVLQIRNPKLNLEVGTLQLFLDYFLAKHIEAKIDYIHGDEVVERLSFRRGNIGFYLPAMDKHELFKTVILDGALPRKTFSMGEAEEKRFYLECRKIK